MVSSGDCFRLSRVKLTKPAPALPYRGTSSDRPSIGLGVVNRCLRAAQVFGRDKGIPPIVAKLHKVGIEVAKPTVEKYKPPKERLPSPTWRTFQAPTSPSGMNEIFTREPVALA